MIVLACRFALASLTVRKAFELEGNADAASWLADGRSTLDLYGDGFVLMRFGREPTEVGALVEAARARSMPLRVETISDPAIAALYEQPLVLVRPDGHVAWRGNTIAEDAGAIVDRIRGAGS